MNKIIKYFGEVEDFREGMKEYNPNYNDYIIETNNLDNRILLKNIENENINLNELYDILGENFYADEDISLEEVLVDVLKENNLILATAESCTGGLIASKIVSIAGASDVFYEGLVTYSNDAKVNRLNIDENVIREYGAVSKETANEMAYGLMNGNVDVGIATTGIAGPSGGTEEKPVGLVYIGVAIKANDPVVNKFLFKGDRQKIRESATNMALFCAYSLLLEFIN